MQLTTFLSTAVAVATVSADVARTAVNLQKSCDMSQPYARIINRCDYPVNIWSVFKGKGCPVDAMVTLKKGEVYAENYAVANDNFENTGVSIKISKTQECKGNDITQLEYFLDNRTSTEEPFRLNYLDVSYVDCVSDCPTKKEGFYLSAGSSASRSVKTAADGSWCPTLACSDAASCAKMAYILPDDVQTKTCDFQSSMDFYMCGSQPPSGDDTPVSSAPASSSKKVETPAYKPATTLKPVISSAVAYQAKVAAVTNAPKIDDVIKAPKVKTKVVYVTAYEYVNAKRHEHAHAHARRHQPFNA